MAKEAAEAAAREARAEEERLSLETTVKRKEEDAADWLAWMESEQLLMNLLPNGHEDQDEPPPPVQGEDHEAMVSMTISKPGESTKMKVWAVQRKGEDSVEAATRFCRAYRVADMKALLDVANHLHSLIASSSSSSGGGQLKNNEYNKENLTADQLEERGRSFVESKGDYSKAVEYYTRAIMVLDSNTHSEQQNSKQQVHEYAAHALRQVIALDDATKLFLNKEWDEAVKTLETFNIVEVRGDINVVIYMHMS
jgi:hypothetical protein